MPTYIPPGTQTEIHREADASITVTCPSCGHLIPHAPPGCLVVDPCTGTAPWLDCACHTHQGISRYRVAIDCPCVARFHLQYSGAGDRYTVMGMDYAVMDVRRREQEALAVTQETTMLADWMQESTPGPEVAPVPTIDPVLNGFVAGAPEQRIEDMLIFIPRSAQEPATAAPPAKRSHQRKR